VQAVRRLHGHLRAAKEAAVERTLPQVRDIKLAPHEADVDGELDEAAEVREGLPLCGATGTLFQAGAYACMALSSAITWSSMQPLKLQQSLQP
jgi:hypothetical protein